MELKVDGHFLYGAPASGLQLEGDMLVAPAPPGGRAFPATSSASPTRRPPATSARRSRTCRNPTTRASRPSPSALRKPPTSTRPQEAQIFIRMAEAGGRAVERKLVLPVAPAANLIGVKPLFGDKSVAEGDKAEFDVVFVAPDGKHAGARRPALRAAEDRSPAISGTGRTRPGNTSRSRSTKRVADGDVDVAADKPARLSLSPQPGRYRLDVKSADADGPITSVQFDVGWYSDGSADTPDLLETSIDKPEYQSGDTMVVSVNARTAGKLTINVLGDRLLTTQTHRRQGRHRAGQDPRRQGLGHRRLCDGDPAPSARCGRPAHARPRDRPEMVRHRQEGAHAAGEPVAAGRWCARIAR